MHERIARMPRMLTVFLLCITIAITAIASIVPQAHADEQPVLPSLIAETQLRPLIPQVRIYDDPTPLSNLLDEAMAAEEKEARNAAKLAALTDEARAGDFYFAQLGSGKCTITSVAMMVRRAAFLDDREDWTDIGRYSVTADGWTSAGVKNSFSTAGYDIDFISTGGSKEKLVELLEEHPEGIAAYDPSVPHAVLLTDYDVETGIFYCADPAGYYSGARIPVADSWNGACRGSQSSVIAGFTKAWVIER